jgi:hypothetical protein
MRLRKASATERSTSSQKPPSCHTLNPSAWIFPCGDSNAHQSGGPASARSRAVTTSNSSFCASGPENLNTARDGRRIVGIRAIQ